MRWRAAAVPLAALTAGTLILSTAAWAQAPDEPTPTPTVTTSPEPTVEPEPAETLEETAAEPQPEPQTKRVEPQASKAPDEASSPERDRRSGGGIEAQASTPTSVNLYRTPKVVPVGGKVTLWGRATPAGGNRWIQIFESGTGRKIKSVRTGGDGRFEVSFTIRRNVAVRAGWHDVKSETRFLNAAPRLRVAMDNALLFSRTLVRGKVSKVAAGKRVKLRLVRTDTGKVAARRTVWAKKTGHFKGRLKVRKPGTYRALAVFDHKGWRRATSKSGRHGTPTPSLGPGSSGVFVKLLERRLDELRHHLSGRNFYYGQDTTDAVMAFNKVHGRARVGSVGADTWHALAAARVPKARYQDPDFHIEVNQSKQVLFVVRNGKVKSILHVSTGAPSTPTYDGTYQFWGKIAGYSPKRLYYPSYFHGARAIHGWPEVPPYNASHGCVRVPMWAARWIFGKTEVGDTIRIYH